ncbi:MAG: hypothetical protein FRX49_10277 [Trebouxia sp. A1-2]|nr:MAG: hypothetical protein FRX49_10277 [Trebouxia sp. A1-2]
MFTKLRWAQKVGMQELRWMSTWIGDPVTTGATLERGAIKLMVDDLLKGPEQDAKEEGSDEQTSIGAKPPSLQ